MIVGPTASGKSDLAVTLAHAFTARTGCGAEIITADAYQIYRGMDIGTAKPTPDEQRGVPHHLIDLVDPIAPSQPQSSSLPSPHLAQSHAPFTVEDWLTHAHAAMRAIRSRGNLPIIVGGTSLYIQSLTRGLFDGPPANEALRAELNALPRETLRAELERVDPAAAQRIHPNDTRRTVRAIEVFRMTGKTISSQQTQWEQTGGADATTAPEGNAAPPFPLFILTWPNELLNRRVNARVKSMIERGLMDEIRTLIAKSADPHPARVLKPQAREALGYKQLLAHLLSPRSLPLDEALEKIKVETRRYAKNQRTWMKRLTMTPGAKSLDASILSTDEMSLVILDALTRPNP